jgi:hypothetical protein
MITGPQPGVDQHRHVVRDRRLRRPPIAEGPHRAFGGGLQDAGAGDRDRTGMASLEGCVLRGEFFLLSAESGRGRAFRLPQRRAHGGGESGLSFLFGVLVAQPVRARGLPEPVHELLGGGSMPGGDGGAPAA